MKVYDNFVFVNFKITSYMGSLLEFHCSIRSVFLSTTVTRILGHFKAITLHVGPPTYPAPMQHIFVITIILICDWIKSKS